jgi:hypothetical protein
MPHANGVEEQRFFHNEERLPYVLSGILFSILILAGIGGLLSIRIFGG